jgi:hypothetical protein
MDEAPTMNPISIIKTILIGIVFVSMSIYLNIGTACAAEFEIEEIITAIKQDIQTARMTGSGTPNFEIETVTTVLTVTSTVTQKGSLLIKVAGYDQEEQIQATDHGAYHKLSFNLTPSGTPGFSTESSFGLVEPINRIKFSLRKAYNNPPYAKLDTFTITLQFAIERESGGGFSFNIIDLNDLKAQNIAIHIVTIYMKIIN